MLSTLFIDNDYSFDLLQVKTIEGIKERVIGCTMIECFIVNLITDNEPLIFTGLDLKDRYEALLMLYREVCRMETDEDVM